MDGWMGGWVNGWMGGKAGLRIAYSNQKPHLFENGLIGIQNVNWPFIRIQSRHWFLNRTTQFNW